MLLDKALMHSCILLFYKFVNIACTVPSFSSPGHSFISIHCLKWVVADVSELGQSLNLLSSILIMLLTCPDSDTLLCYNNSPFLTEYSFYSSVHAVCRGTTTFCYTFPLFNHMLGSFYLTVYATRSSFVLYFVCDNWFLYLNAVIYTIA